MKFMSGLFGELADTVDKNVDYILAEAGVQLSDRTSEAGPALRLAYLALQCFYETHRFVRIQKTTS